MDEQNDSFEKMLTLVDTETDSRMFNEFLTNILNDEFSAATLKQYKLVGNCNNGIFVTLSVLYCFLFGSYNENSGQSLFSGKAQQIVLKLLCTAGGTLSIAQNYLYLTKKRRLRSLMKNIKGYMHLIDASIDNNKNRNEKKDENDNKNNDYNYGNKNDKNGKYLLSHEIDIIEALTKENISVLRDWQSLVGTCNSRYVDILTGFYFAFYMSLRHTEAFSEKVYESYMKQHEMNDTTKISEISETSEKKEINEIKKKDTSETLKDLNLPDHKEYHSKEYNPIQRSSPYGGPGMTGFDPRLLTESDVLPLNYQEIHDQAQSNKKKGDKSTFDLQSSMMMLYFDAIGAFIISNKSFLPLPLMAILRLMIYSTHGNGNHNIKCSVFKRQCMITTAIACIINIPKAIMSKGYYYHVAKNLKLQWKMQCEKNKQNEKNEEKEFENDGNFANEKNNRKNLKFLENSNKKFHYVGHAFVKCLPWYLFGVAGYVSGIAIFGPSAIVQNQQRNRKSMQNTIGRPTFMLSLWKRLGSHRASKLFKLIGISHLLLGLYVAVGTRYVLNKGQFMVENFGESTKEEENAITINDESIDFINEKIAKFKMQGQNEQEKDQENDFAAAAPPVCVLFSKSSAFEMRQLFFDHVSSLAMWCEDKWFNSWLL